MVLKYSNSRFNSGATQRFCNRGVYRKVGTFSESQCTLHIALEGVPGYAYRDNPSTAHLQALDKIYEYLEIQGPSWEDFYYCRRWHYGQRYCSIPMNKSDYWRLSLKIDSLMEEADLIKVDEGTAEIHINKITYWPHNQRLYAKKSCVLKARPAKKVANVVDCSKKKRRQECRQNTRGMQRLQQKITPEVANLDEDDQEIHWKKIVLVELKYEKDIMDSRALRSPKNNTGTVRMRQKSQLKCKSSKIEKFSDLSGCRTTQIKIGKKAAISDLMSPTNYWAGEGNYDSCDDEQDEYEVHEQFYEDLFVPVINKSQKSKKKSQKDKIKFVKTPATDEEEQLVNTASSKCTFRHQKGSFQFIDRYQYDDIECTGSDSLTTDDDYVHVGIDDVHAEIEENQSDLSNDRVQHTQAKLEMFDSCDQFVRINLQLGNDIRRLLMPTTSCLDDSRTTHSVKDCPMLFANCYPPVFCIKLQQLKVDSSISNSNDEWSLFGASSSNMTNDNCRHFQWEVTLKHNEESDSDDIIKDHFLFPLGNKTCDSSWTLDDLVETALTSIQSTSCVNEAKAPETKLKKRISRTYYEHKSPVSKVLSLDDALRNLDAIDEQMIDVSVRSDQELTLSLLDTICDIVETQGENADCDVCFSTCDSNGLKESGMVTLLPCRHSFCYECWKSHIFHSIMKGDGAIRCMNSECKEVLNETMMNAFIPGNYMRRFVSQKKERRVDRSPLCQWCPRNKCNKVALVEEWKSSIQDFGFTVSCDCNSSWCFTCKAKPHWPSSCDQNATYRKLLTKVGEELQSTAVNLFVDVKPCPGCRYPTEKDGGCGSMRCRICLIEFCWNCLQPSGYHDPLYCQSLADGNFVTYLLHNDAINDFPLKCFAQSLEMRKKQRALEIDSKRLQGWFVGLDIEKYRRIHLPFHRSVQQQKVELTKEDMVDLASEIMTFLWEAYSFLEQFYLLLSFAFLDKTSEKSYLMSVQRASDRLAFTTSRLEVLILKKYIRQIMQVEHCCRMSLSEGRDLMDQLTRNVTKLRKLSRNVPTEPYGELDPAKFYHYK